MTSSSIFAFPSGSQTSTAYAFFFSIRATCSASQNHFILSGVCFPRHVFFTLVKDHRRNISEPLILQQAMVISVLVAPWSSHVVQTD
jgi:hypothetical protein